MQRLLSTSIDIRSIYNRLKTSIDGNIKSIIKLIDNLRLTLLQMHEEIESLRMRINNLEKRLDNFKCDADKREISHPRRSERIKKKKMQ
mgnify:CR=1 FL=1